MSLDDDLIRRVAARWLEQCDEQRANDIATAGNELGFAVAIALVKGHLRDVFAELGHLFDTGEEFEEASARVQAIILPVLAERLGQGPPVIRGRKKPKPD